MPKPQIQKHYRTCNLCEAMCGVAIEVEDQQILSIKGDPNDPFSKGHICPKALALKDFHEDPDRLRSPVMKTDDGWKEISWDKAFDIVGSNLRQLRENHGRNAIGVYLGNPNVHHHGNLLFGLALSEALNTQNRFSATSNDQLPHMLANLQMFGHQLLFPVPDIDHTDLFILIGSNPAASNGSTMSAPDFQGKLKSIRKRGGEVILVDPRKTETARVADQHIFIRPGTDAFMLLAIVNTLFDEGLVEAGRLTSCVDDIAQVQLACADFTADAVAPITGISAEQIKTLARKLATTPRASMFGRIGTSVQEFGGISTWLIYVINTLTNHLDERGGLMFTKPAADMIGISELIGQKGHFDTYHSKSGLPEFGGDLPANTMADQILLPGKNQVKAMLTIAGNPVLSSPNGRRLDQAFESLEFMVCVDAYINETSRHADVILPPTSHLEQSHYDLAFNMVSIRNVAKYSPALFKPAKHARHDWQILLEIIRRVAPKDLKTRAQAEVAYQALKRLGADGLLDLILRTGPYGTQIPGTSQMASFLIDTVQDVLKPKHPLRKIIDIGPYGSPNRSLSKGLCVSSLMNYPHGVDLGSLQSCLPERLFTPNKHVKLAPSIYLKDMSRVRKRFNDWSEPSEGQFVLIGRRHVRSNNSWLHNSHRLVKGKSRCTMMINPADAKTMNLQDGQLVTVKSRVGKIDIATEITDEILQGVISIPHGWGHNRRGIKQDIAQKNAGVSINDIIDDQSVDKLCGTSVLNGQIVSLETQKSRRKSAQSARRKTSPNKTAPKKRIRVSAKLS